MALITCPECNKQISDRAAACPHCGYPLPAPNVDVPASDHPAADIVTQNVDSIVVSTKPRKKRVLLIAIICAFALACIGGVIVFSILKHQQEIAKQEELERAQEEARTEYIENLNEFTRTALYGGADAEKICNLTQSVWYDSIYEEYDVETAPYTQTNGKFHDDFNVSLSKLYASSTYQSAVSDIKENRLAVEALYKELLNPEDEFKDCFEEVEALYSAYYDLTKLAISPSGSLKSYSENLSEYDKDFISHYDKLRLLIPEK